MSSLPKVAIAGATGNLGAAVLKALLDAGFPVTVLTRDSSTSKLPDHPNQTIKNVDYTSHSSLVDALTGIDVAIAALSITGLGLQKLLADAALAAGVSRFLPAEFGADFDAPAAKALPAFQVKVDTREYVRKLSRENSNFSYTLVETGAFFDWGIQVGWLVNSKEHSATLFNGGDVPFSTIRLSTIGQAVVGILKQLDATKNQVVKIHDGTITQNKIIAAIKKKDGVEWKTEVQSTKDILKWSLEEFDKPDGDKMNALMAMVNVIVFTEGNEYGHDMSGQTWNARLGLKELNDEEMSQVVLQVA